MNVSGYGLNVQYQKTQLSYEMSLSKVNSNEETQKVLDENSEIDETNSPIVYMSEDDLNSSEILTKMILEATYAQYSSSSSSESLIPNIKTTNSEDIPEEVQAYANQQNLPTGLTYTSSSEYYEKTTIDFSGEIRIKTPEGEYSIELNLSYTQEFYEKNATFIEVASESFQSPFEIELAEENENLKNLNAINLLFDVIPEEQETDEENNFFAQLIEYLQERSEYKEDMIEKKNEEKMDNFQVYMSRNEESQELISAQKDGLGVFFSNSQSESSYLNIASNANGSYISAGYSSSETTTMASFESIKV
ncbi:hypothetical protein OAR97_01330 [Arcobacteraceae bacterium]|nr:hypothetical protein [Arcobacteraceae bacterium]